MKNFGIVLIVASFLIASQFFLTAETILGKVYCPIDGMQISVELPDNIYIGPLPIINGEYEIALPEGTREGKLTVHKLGKNPRDYFADRERYPGKEDGLMTNLGFSIPEGQLSMVMPDFIFSVIEFNMKLPINKKLYLTVFRENAKIYGSRTMVFPEDYTLLYAASPNSTYQLKIFTENENGKLEVLKSTEIIKVLAEPQLYKSSIDISD